MSHRRAPTHSNLARVHLQKLRYAAGNGILGGKTLLWCENGIVFLRPPQAPADVFPEGAGSLPRLLRSRSPSALSERDHLFTGRCDLVIPPLSRDLPRSPLNSRRKSAQPTKADEEGSSPSSKATTRVHADGDSEKEREREKAGRNGSGIVTRSSNPWGD
ncbi:unnamed protein product [Lasius platythorax]|uniref:Uncharacterized protein n=1 Tax=Lasius platythorax TaxID=488582 RepID=A0AAV2N5P6_9HYME